MENDMNPEVIGALLMVLNQEEEEEEQVRRTIAEIAVAELVEMEDGIGLADQQALWVPVRVFINDYHTLGDPCFKLHFRMSRGLFESLTGTLHNHLVRTGKLRRERTPLQDVVLMVLWLIATPDTFRSVALRFGVNPGTLYYFYSYIIEALRELAAEYIQWPGPEERAHIKAAFARATGFPGVIGCIDCTHVTITAPLQDPGQHINRHHQYSINVQAVVDHTLTVRQLHVGEVGSMNDNRVFRRSPLYEDLLRDQPEIISPDEHLVGDGAYTLTNFMMIPFPNNGHLTEEQLNYNRRLSQCRVRVENSFGHAKGRWRRLKFLHARNRDIVVDHITASFVLHNFLVREGEPMLEENELARPININEVPPEVEEQVVDDPDVPEDQERRQEAAEARGAEKQWFIMNLLND
ncbi:Protein ANTAGONIST OF LIKE HETEROCHROMATIN PROTEIN 1 [Frankliniella fusca]|nr:Protein ANTAGONIST OF LIKE HETEROCHROMATIN PROTEIN 1 [Frankliniella fusca]